MDYEFTQDWFSRENPAQVVKQFEQFLLPYKTESCVFLEIGCFEGMSTIWMLENVLLQENSQIFLLIMI